MRQSKSSTLIIIFLSRLWKMMIEIIEYMLWVWIVHRKCIVRIDCMWNIFFLHLKAIEYKLVWIFLLEFIMALIITLKSDKSLSSIRVHVFFFFLMHNEDIFLIASEMKWPTSYLLNIYECRVLVEEIAFRQWLHVETTQMQIGCASTIRWGDGVRGWREGGGE